MLAHSNPGSRPALPGCQVEEVSLPQLVGEVYKAAPATEKMRLLEFLLPTLGVMPLIVIANGLYWRRQSPQRPAVRNMAAHRSPQKRDRQRGTAFVARCPIQSSYDTIVHPNAPGTKSR